jgi:hypothetical protein
MTTKAEMIKRAQAWQAERQAIFLVEGETGVLDHDAIHANDDDAVDIADWVAAGCPDDSVVTSCSYCGMALHQDAEGVWVDETDGDCCSGDENLDNENEPHVPFRYEETFPTLEEGR